MRKHPYFFIVSILKNAPDLCSVSKSGLYTHLYYECDDLNIAYIIPHPDSHSMTTVVVNMKFCNKTHRITVNMKDDGDLSLKVDSDCPEVMYYAQCIGDTITMEDITDINNSKVLDPENLSKITLTCLAPNGILNAAWLETGMMSKSMAKEVKENTVSFEYVDE